MLEFGLVLAQLRDMLAAEDSTVVPQENDYSGIGFPQRTETDIAALRFGQHNLRQLRAEGFRHAQILTDDGWVRLTASGARHSGSV